MQICWHISSVSYYLDYQILGMLKNIIDSIPNIIFDKILYESFQNTVCFTRY